MTNKPHLRSVPVKSFCLSFLTTFFFIANIILSLDSPSVQATTTSPHSLIKVGINELNNHTSTGDYFSVGPTVDDGRFKVDIHLPNKMTWALTSSNDKVTREFKWNSKDGIIFKGNPKETNSSLFSDLAQSVLGKITLNTFISQFESLSDPKSIGSLTSNITAKASKDSIHVFISSAIPGLKSFKAEWVFDKKSKRSISWKLKSSDEEHFLVFDKTTILRKE